MISLTLINSLKFFKVISKKQVIVKEEVPLAPPLNPALVTSTIKHRNTAEKIITYTHRVYSLLLTEAATGDVL